MACRAAVAAAIGVIVSDGTWAELGATSAVDAVTQAATLMFASPGVNLHTSTAQPPSASSAPSAQPVPVEQSRSTSHRHHRLQRARRR